MSVCASAMRSPDAGVVERVGVHRPRQGDHRLEVGLHRDREAGGADAFVAERPHGHLPALALVAESVRDGHAGVGEEHLVEHLLAGDVADRTALDAVGIEVDDQRGDAFVLRAPVDRGRVGAHEEQAPLRDVRGRDPDLLAVQDVVVAVAQRERAQVGAGRIRLAAR